MNPSKEEPMSVMTNDDSFKWTKCDAEQMTNSYIASDVHLQNLGLSMTCGKPRFKLNEMCSSFATSSVCQPNFQDDKDSTPSESFVVLSHPSLEMVQAQSLNNYIQIQEKCTSIDYNSVISGMTPLEIEQKLSDLLQENAKLKETLIENNVAMKKQFNSLAAWQETISSVHQNHREKFAETRELMEQLKKENMKLKIKVSISELQDVSLQKTAAEDHSILPSLTHVCNCSCRAELVKLLKEKMMALIDHDETCLKSVENLNATVENSDKNLTEECQALQKMDTKIILPTLKLKECTEEGNKMTITSIQLPDYVESIVKRIPRTEFRQQLIDNMKPYHESLEVLINCFSVQSSRYVHVQECIKKCIEILQNCGTINSKIPNDRNSTMISYKNSLSECRQKLIDEQLKDIDHHQKWIRIQNHLKKLFYDYTSTLCEFEILQEQNRKLLTIQKENDHENYSCDKHSEKENTILKEKVINISLEKLSLHEEKKSLDKLQKSLVIDRESLNTEVEKLKLERLNLLGEKTALDRQSKMYEEQERALIIEKRNFMKMSEELTGKIVDLEEKLKNQNESTYTDKENLMILRAQLDIYRTDFEQEKAAKKNLIREKNKLVEQIQSLTVHNQNLRKDMDRLRQGEQTFLPSSSRSQRNQESTNSSTSTMIPLFLCPLCSQKYPTLELLVEHTEACIK
ncbi:optineurin isoform X2 [Leptopilina boulardi]|uniref:optineurin isoform X2 n=1 Tax=Leptopilina boulardi TaxID=63433 RepID=UPI0021F60F82|nr:optineurin isoform X2 [Leptopilina boulardi]